jgi:hypothetical protein
VRGWRSTANMEINFKCQKKTVNFCTCLATSSFPRTTVQRVNHDNEMKFAVQDGLRRGVKKESLLTDYKDHEGDSSKPSRKSLVCTDDQGVISQKTRLYIFHTHKY